MVDPYNLQRFVVAQDPVFEQVALELKSGRKQGHWMWFVFPQLKGLGTSLASTIFGISSKGEAEAYLSHPVLGRRLQSCTELVLLNSGPSVREIFGHPDDLKFHSCMTLFTSAMSGDCIFHKALQKYFAGEPDRRTLDLLMRQACSHDATGAL